MTRNRDRRQTSGPDELGVRRSQSRRRKRFRLLAVTVLVLLTLVFAIWSVVYILTSEEEATRLSFLTKGSVDRSLAVSLIFIEEGVPITSPGSGILLPLVDEGDRVARDVEIALLVPLDKEAQVQRYKETKEAYNARLLVVRGFADLSRNPLALSPADSRLRESITGVTRAQGSEAMTRALGIFRYRLPLAQSEAGLFRREDAQLDQLASDLSDLVNLIRADDRTRVVRAPLTGLVTFPVPDSLTAYADVKETPLSLVTALATSPWITRDSRYQRVEAAEVLALVNRFSGRTLAVYVPEPDEEDLTLRVAGKLDLVEEAQGLDLQGCEISRLDRLDQGLLICLNYEDWSGYQPAYAALEEVNLLLPGQEGLRLALTSLMDLDLERGEARLMKVSGGLTESIEVRILASDDRYAIIEAGEGAERDLNEADLYVVNPWTTEEGLLID